MGEVIPPGGAFSCSKLQTCAASDLPDLPASKIDSGTFNLARIPAVDDAHIPDVESLSYGAAFDASQIPDLPTSKITEGTFNSDRIPYGTVVVTFIIDGGGAAIETGEKGYLEIPFDATVEEWRLLAGTVGDITIDVWKDSYSNFPPSNADAMPGAGNEPSITAGRKAESTDLSAWTETDISKGDILAFNVDSCGTIERCTLSMSVRRK